MVSGVSTDRDATLLLLHGLGANSGVWAGVIEQVDWPGRVVALDLPGHGAAPWTDDYTIDALATAVAADFGDGEPVVIVGHSLGGGVGVELAAGRYRPAVQAVAGIGIKTSWTDADVVGMVEVADRGVRWFETREDAVTRFLRQSGLDGLIDDTHPAVGLGVAEREGRWRPTQDPATFAQKPLDMAKLIGAATCPVLLGAGEHDAMATRVELAAFTEDPQIVSGRGHNVHVEDPSWVVGLIEQLGV